MAPMGPVGYADSFGGFNQRLQDYYVERAKNNVGLIITGICSVDMSIEGIPANGLPCPALRQSISLQVKTPTALIRVSHIVK